jgi:hypothetical protein
MPGQVAPMLRAERDLARRADAIESSSSCIQGVGHESRDA